MHHQKGLETVGKEAYSILVQFYEYDRNVPLDAKVLYRDEHEAYFREKIVLNGKTDPWGNLDEVQSLYELVGSPSKELVLFEGGHGPLVDYIPRAVEWFRQYLR